MIEIIFHARTPDNIPYYKLNDDEEEPMVLELIQILQDGQKKGEFRRFNPIVMASVIRSAIWEYSSNPNVSSKVDLESYSKELIDLFDRAILKDGNTDG